MRKRDSSQNRCASKPHCGHLGLNSTEETLADNERHRIIPRVGGRLLPGVLFLALPVCLQEGKSYSRFVDTGACSKQMEGLWPSKYGQALIMSATGVKGGTVNEHTDVIEYPLFPILILQLILIDTLLQYIHHDNSEITRSALFNVYLPCKVMTSIHQVDSFF